MPLGRTPAHLRDIRAQPDSGFSGIRCSGGLRCRQLGYWSLLGAAGAFPLVVGEQGAAWVAARLLVDFLDRYSSNFVIAGHFAGPTDTPLLDTEADVGRLFDHPRFHVAFTRHGALSHLPLESWARAVVSRIGWSRVLWGSEWPVALWRDETYRSTLDWVLRLDPPDAAVRAVRYDNAETTTVRR